jgi:hypothetical protein
MKDGGPAFPRPQIQDCEHNQYWAQDGMGLRDYFAAKAMQGLIANHEFDQIVELSATEEDEETGWKAMATIAYRAADAMLAEREK